jgi:hypothetical protein
MKNFPLSFLLGLALVLMLGACRKKADVNTGVADLEKAFPTTAAPPPAPAQPGVATPAPQSDANDLVRQALAAQRANDYAGGVIALQAAQQRPGLTAQQVMATEQAKDAMVQELQRRAVNGDQRALAQLRAIERTLSQ